MPLEQESYLMSMLEMNMLILLLVIFEYGVLLNFWKLKLLKYLIMFSAKCIDYYTQQRVLEAEGKLAPGSKSIDPRLEGIVNRMFQRCLDDNQYRQALGLALETRRMDIFEAAIMQSVSRIINFFLIYISVLYILYVLFCIYYFVFLEYIILHMYPFIYTD